MFAFADTLDSSSLGNVSCPPDDTDTAVNGCDQPRHSFGTHTNIYDPMTVQAAIPPSAIAPLALHDMRLGIASSPTCTWLSMIQ